MKNLIKAILFFAFAAVARAQISGSDYIVRVTNSSAASGGGYSTLTAIGAAMGWASTASPTFTGTVTLPSGQALIAPALGTPTSGTLTNCTFPTLNQNTSGSAASLSAPLSFANGGETGSAATSATTGTISVSMTTACVTITPTGACTFNAGAGGTAGQEVTFFVTTSGVSSFVLTFGTNYHSIGTLATGTTSARFFTVTFKSNGTAWFEIARTAVQT